MQLFSCTLFFLLSHFKHKCTQGDVKLTVCVLSLCIIPLMNFAAAWVRINALMSAVYEIHWVLHINNNNARARGYKRMGGEELYSLSDISRIMDNISNGQWGGGGAEYVIESLKGARM